MSQTDEFNPQQEIENLIEDLRSSDAVPGIPVGSTAPLFELTSGAGETVALRDQLSMGPVVLVFYRGGWCPYCHLHLAELHEALQEIRSLGASLIAVSPQRPDDSLSLAELLELGFEVLSDPDQRVIRDYNLQFELPEALHDWYSGMGMGLDEQNADGTWNLPVPVTFVLDRTGNVAAAHVDPNYRERMSAEAVLDVLRQLQ